MQNARWSCHEAEVLSSVKRHDRRPRIKMQRLTNFVIESLHILILTVVGAAKHGDHPCITETCPFPLRTRSLSALFSTVQSATTKCVKTTNCPSCPTSSQIQSFVSDTIICQHCTDVKAAVQTHAKHGNTELSVCMHLRSISYTHANMVSINHIMLPNTTAEWQTCAADCVLSSKISL